MPNSHTLGWYLKVMFSILLTSGIYYIKCADKCKKNPQLRVSRGFCRWADRFAFQRFRNSGSQVSSHADHGVVACNQSEELLWIQMKMPKKEEMPAISPEIRMIPVDVSKK